MQPQLSESGSGPAGLAAVLDVVADRPCFLCSGSPDGMYIPCAEHYRSVKPILVVVRGAIGELAIVPVLWDGVGEVGCPLLDSVAFVRPDALGADDGILRRALRAVGGDLLATSSYGDPDLKLYETISLAALVVAWDAAQVWPGVDADALGALFAPPRTLVAPGAPRYGRWPAPWAPWVSLGERLPVVGSAVPPVRAERVGAGARGRVARGGAAGAGTGRAPLGRGVAARGVAPECAVGEGPALDRRPLAAAGAAGDDGGGAVRRRGLSRGPRRQVAAALPAASGWPAPLGDRAGARACADGRGAGGGGGGTWRRGVSPAGGCPRSLVLAGRSLATHVASLINEPLTFVWRAQYLLRAPHSRAARPCEVVRQTPRRLPESRLRHAFSIAQISGFQRSRTNTGHARETQWVNHEFHVMEWPPWRPALPRVVRGVLNATVSTILADTGSSGWRQYCRRFGAGVGSNGRPEPRSGIQSRA